MQQLQMTPALAREMRFAGLLYLVIIVAGLSAELLLRGPLNDLEDANATATAILSAPGQFRLAIAADLVMAVCDKLPASLVLDIVLENIGQLVDKVRKVFGPIKREVDRIIVRELAIFVVPVYESLEQWAAGSRVAGDIRQR